MNQRKLSFSLLIIMISVLLLVSGTFAWFLVGKLAQLGDLSFTVIDSGEGVEIQGSGGTAYISADDNPENLTLTEWGKMLKLENFKDGEFLPVAGDGDAVAGTYSPVSPASFRTAEGETSQFIKVGVRDRRFVSSEAVAAQHYNDFSINLRSETETPVDVEMTINIHPAEDARVDATTAGRVAVTYNGETRIFALNDSGTMNVVSRTFPNDSIADSNDNRIIDSNEGSSVLTSRNITKLEIGEDDTDGEVKIVCTGNMVDASGNYIDNEGNVVSTGRGYILEGVSGNKGYSTIYVQTWIEGNDPDCVDFSDRSIASGSFIVDIGFSAYKAS